MQEKGQTFDRYYNELRADIARQGLSKAVLERAKVILSYIKSAGVNEVTLRYVRDDLQEIWYLCNIATEPPEEEDEDY